MLNMDTGTTIVVGMVLLFYMRLIIIQWGKADRHNRARKQGKKNKDANYDSLKFNFNWLLIGIGGAFIVFGAVMRGTGLLGLWLEQNWWIFVSVGIFIFGMGIRK